MKENNPVKLTSLTTKGGCGCKIGPADLAEVLGNLPLATAESKLTRRLGYR